MADDSGPMSDGFLEIDIGRARRWRGFALYLLAFFGVAALLVVLFVYLTASVALSVSVVLVMLASMGLMAWATTRNLDGRG